MSKNPWYVNLKKTPNLADLLYLEESINALPDKKITSNVVETSERIRIFPDTSPFPGKHRYSRSPYMYEIAMSLSPQDPTESVVVCKAGQMGATANSTESLILFKISEDPGPVLAMVPTEEFLKKWDESRIMPMIESSGLLDSLSSTYKKNSQHGGKGNATGRKSWPGGRLDILTFQQVNQLRNQSYQVIIFEDAEEIMNATKRGVNQGSLKKVAYTRTNAYAGRRKILDISTPLIRQGSHIWAEFLSGDQRYYYIPCPKCGHMQRLEWKHLKFTHDEHNHLIRDSVYYECQKEGCGYHIKDEEKVDFLLCKELGGQAEWRPHNAEKARPFTKSYQFSALYAGPGMDTWYDLAQQWIDAQGDPEELQAFINLKLGEPYDDYSETPMPETLHVLKGAYKKGYLPTSGEKPLFAMLGCDVQQGNKRDGKWVKGKESRIEASLWGFGLNDRTWELDHYVIRGDVDDWRGGAFAKLREMIVQDIFPIPPVKIFIDSRYQTDEVRSFCNGALNIFPIMGESKIKKVHHKVDLPGYRSGLGGPLPMYELSANSTKRKIYNRLGLRRDELTGNYPSGYISFPLDMEARYFEQLTAERPEPIEKNGRIIGYNFVAHGANEALDCTVYAWMAKEIYIEETSILHGEEAANHRLFWDWAARFFKLKNISENDLKIKQEKLFKILRG